ncbi:MAG TPA: 8-oxo-dGTP diphosphatase [Micromonosporaceae bacterium]|nr:8-oxo-dGTP diphosphatase [Micromonosporaceae bacterium]
MVSTILQTAVYVLSPDRTQVLLMHRNKRREDIHFGKYLSIGGHVDPGEDVLTGARREVREESGLTVTDLSLRGTVLWTGFGPERLDYLCFVFRADTFAGTPHGGNGEGSLEWVPVDDLTSRPIWASDHHWLPMVFDESSKPFYGFMPYDGREMISWSFQR